MKEYEQERRALMKQSVYKVDSLVQDIELKSRYEEQNKRL